MKAPDKIYTSADRGDSGIWYAKPFGNEVAYIRKDALMEWASNRLGKVSDMGFDDGDVEHGYIRALQDVVDKLNEM